MRGYVLLLALTVAGCASPSARVPSLAPRVAEAIDPRAPVPEPQLSTVVDARLAAQLSTLIAQAEAGDAQFRAATASAREAAAAAGSRGSESWVAAQQALSALVAARAPVTRALGDLDALGAVRIQRLGGIAAADMRAIQSAAGRVAEIDRRQATLIKQLQAQLG